MLYTPVQLHTNIIDKHNIITKCSHSHICFQDTLCSGQHYHSHTPNSRTAFPSTVQSLDELALGTQSDADHVIEDKDMNSETIM